MTFGILNHNKNLATILETKVAKSCRHIQHVNLK